MNRFTERQSQRLRRQKRVRAQVRGTSDRPRLCVFRSARHISAQLIDDSAGRTLAASSDLELMRSQKKGQPPVSRPARAAWVGQRLAERAREKGIAAARFDRGAYHYHGLVAALADGARKGGLKV